MPHPDALAAPDPSRRLFLIAFWAFAGTIAFAIAGTLSLYIGPVSDFFLPYYDTLVNVPTWSYMVLLPILPLALYWPELGAARSVGFLIAASLIGAGAELMGTNTGVPFGAYVYTDRLGPKLLDDVPYVIPTSWYAVAILSYDLAGRLGWGRIGRVLGTAALMVVWDVSLDPAMNQGGGTFVFWEYPGGGPYYGMPWVNWAGWAVTSVVIALAFEALGGLPAAMTELRRRYAAPLYALNILFPAAICLLYGLPVAGAIGLAALAAVLWLVRSREARALARA